MAKCLSCNNDIAKGEFKSNCPYCNYPQPTSSNKSLIISWCLFAFIFSLCGFLLSWVFFIIILLHGLYFLSILKQRKKGSFAVKQSPVNDELEKHRNLFASKNKPTKTINYNNLDLGDEDDYQEDDDDDLFQEQDFSDFENSLMTIWNKDSHHIISFDYINSSGDDISREIQLTEVKINQYNEVYLIGYCFDSNEDRTFKAERISGNIKYAGEDYRIAKFLINELGLNVDDVKKLKF